jgi:oligopeptide/dipeptide ABC transporter ATP-binding protein
MLESPVMPETSTRNLVEIRGLVKHFDVRSEGKLRQQRRVVHAINGVDLDVPTGEIVALVGESGSGKTTLANCVAGFVTPTSGTIGFDGRPLVETRGATVSRRASRRDMAQNIQMVFQDPSSALNPRQTVESTLLEPLLVHRVMPKPEAVTRVTELLELSGIPASMRRRYPHELNSGQRQRLVIARALALSPRLLLADEPVSRLDVSMQSQILNLLLDLRERLGLTIVFITHDLSVVRQVADTVVVMYLGRVMESCSADAFFSDPRHPYSQALVAATPRPMSDPTEIATLHGEIPSPINLPSGCPFHTRCPMVGEGCTDVVPELREVAAGHRAACIKL